MNSNSAYLNLAAYVSSPQPTSATTPTRARLVNEQGASGQDLEDVTCHEDPNTLDQTHQDDTDYVEGRQSARRVPTGRRNGNPRQATSGQPASVPNRNPRKASAPSGPATTRPPAAASATPPILPPVSTGNGIPPEPIIDPALLSYPPLHLHPQTNGAVHPQATPLHSNIQTTSQAPPLPMSVWSDSSSPHRNITLSNFQVPQPSPSMWPPTQNTMVAQAQYSSPFGVSSPLPQAVFVDQSVGGGATQTQARQATPTGTPESDLEGESDVLGTLHNKTRKRRGRLIQLPLAVRAEQSAGLLTIEADPQNISSWPAPQRPLLLLARFEYGALLNTENGAASPSALGRASPWHHPAITSVIINSTFSDQEAEGVLTKQRYLPLIPAPVIFLACTAIQHALEMWSSGVKVQQPFKFDAT
ncbi:hypothetical protein M407DRAFT_32512 [Tulasnella calospora MUT 4182]|uniref:DUF6532 domain-containing protein n=1 Tax=Tulasnella calospora MUT 4182 TaxID=1051891 RepID=A0A0C3PSV5_9AGAM|nr:hypothetical protein M407DRAFT_32512 [Tulasnella calospora MUT 4182]